MIAVQTDALDEAHKAGVDYGQGVGNPQTFSTDYETWAFAAGVTEGTHRVMQLAQAVAPFVAQLLTVQQEPDNVVPFRPKDA